MQFIQVVAAMGILFLAPSLGAKTCQRDSRLGKMRLKQAIRQDILQRLGFEEEPTNPFNASDIPEEFLKEYEAVKEAQELNREHTPCAILDFNTREVMPVSPKEVKKLRPNLHTAVGDDCVSDPSVDFYNAYRIKFQVDLSNKDFITNAQLRLKKSFLQLTEQSLEAIQRSQKDRVDVRLVSRPENYDGEEKHVYITMQFLAVDDINGLAIFNVTEAVVLWLEFPTHSLSHMGELELDVRLRCPQPLTHGATFVPNFQFFESSNNDGLLVLTTYKKKNGNQPTRQKRQDINSDLTFCNENQVECCLIRFRVNFERDFNWTWVIRPKEIAFNYCKGECPIKWGLSTVHAQFLDVLRYRARHNPTAAPEPCCVPNTFADIPLAIIVRGRFSMQNLEDIVATSCACR